MEGTMAEPVRNEEPLSIDRFPDPAAGSRPVPIRETPENRALLPEHATQQPLGAWPRGVAREEGRVSLQNVKQRVKPIADFVQGRAADVRRRFRVIRGRVESGDLQEDLRNRASVLADQAANRAEYARNRAEAYARANPLHLIAGAAAAGFLLGIVLRMWRDE
jgi:ElaB/YqjD/DUF883 family membrane-anchored ribosome-binding protein